MCSTIIFGAGPHKYLAENYDHSLDHGLIAVNLKDTIKENGRLPGEKAICWRVNYGSITFNQFSLELPVSGINEKGLCVALMWHYEGNFGTDKEYCRISALQWIQFQLDNYRNIAEVLEGLKYLRPKQEGVPLHYTLLDAEGNSLLLEFIHGEPQAHKNQAYPILTNSTYPLCMDAANSPEKKPENSSITRFIRLYSRYTAYCRSDIGPAKGFELLQSVDQTQTGDEIFPWHIGNSNNTVTAWSIVFDPAQKIILLKTHKNKSVRTIKLSEFNFEKESAYLVMDINESIGENTLQYFKPYSKELNLHIIQQTARAFQLPEQEQENLANLVDSLYLHRKMSLG